MDLSAVGFGLLAIAGAVAWIYKMNSHASSPASVASHDEQEPAEALVSPALKIVLAPKFEDGEPYAREELGPDIESHDSPEEVVAEAISQDVVPDSEHVREQLNIAEKLGFIGDLEGMVEFAELALNDPNASPRQRNQADILIRRASSL
ncbi:hypothetical protein [Pseudomonas saponiphila]|nr:hypothetical protein [Pseudomonas saponiphila]